MIFENVRFLNESYKSIEDFEIDKALNLPSSKDIDKAEKEIGIKFGPQLKEYLSKYGMITYKYLEFYGVTTKGSNMVRTTINHHNIDPATKDYIAFEFIGNGDLAVVDGDDNIYYYNHENSKITSENVKLFDYLLKRFEEADKYDK